MTSTAVDLTECPNCGTPLHAAFCPSCGQKAAPLNPSFAEFVHELVHELVHVDGKIVQSVRLLLTRPGFLTREQFAGRRASYVSPIRLYLVFSLLYFAAVAFGPVTALRLKEVTPKAGETAQELEVRRQEIQLAGNEAIAHWTPRIMFLLVPVFAGLVALTARRSGRNYPQHLYFSLHVHAAWFFAGAVSTLARLAALPGVTPTLPRLATLYGAAYFVLALRHVYGLSFGAALWRAVFVFFTYAIVVMLALIAIAWAVILRG